MTNTTNKIKYLSVPSYLFVLSVLLVLFVLFSLFPGKTFAESFSLGLFPPVIPISTEPGSDIEKQIDITNNLDIPQTLNIAYRQFTGSEAKNGQISFIPNNSNFEKFLNNVSILQADQAVQRITLSAKQTTHLLLKISVPKDYPASDYNFTILFTGISTPQVSNYSPKAWSQLQGAIGTNILLSIINDTTIPQAVLETYSVPLFTENGPVPFTILINNIGKQRITTKGIIKIKNMFGQLIGVVNLPEKIILSNTSRFLSNNVELTNKTQGIKNPVTNGNNLLTTTFWNEKVLFGIYNAEITLSLSDKGPDFVKSIYFFAFPYKIVFVFILSIILLLLIRSRVKKYLSN